MFENKNIQYVNIKQHDKQLKIDNKILKDNKVTKSDTSSFIIETELSTDVVSKINILQQDITKTYISTLNESKTQQIIKTDDLEFNEDNYEMRKLNAHFNIAMEKSEIEAQKQYFQSTGIDYILSPFTILYNHIMTNGANTNSLNILILNNTIYALILDIEKRIVFSSIKTLTGFDEIQESNFYEDELDGQKLFDEVHNLEIQETITEITNEFYELSEDEVFCESVSLFYTIRQLSEEQVTILEGNIMMEVEYNLIPIDTYIFNILQQPTTSKYSFIQPREKKNKNSFLLFLVAALISTVVVANIFFYIQEQNEIEEAKKVEQARLVKEAEALAKKIAESKKVKLPNHQEHNNKISKLILSIFDIIPYNAILNELRVSKTDATFVCNFLNKNTFEEEIQPKLLKVYKNSEILLIQDNKKVFNAIISNTQLLKQKSSTKKVKFTYKKGKFLTKPKLVFRMESLLPKGSIIKFKSKRVLKFTTYNFTVNTVFNTPKDFFSFIEMINKQSMSVNIAYPIEFAKTKKGLETTFDLEINQFNTKKSIKNK